MKISTVLSVSALFAMFSVVACSSSAVPADSGDKSDSAASDDADDDTKKTSTDKTTTPASNTTTGDTTTGDTTTGDASEAACLACINEDPASKKANECAAKCAETDDSCVDKCFTDAGCTDENSSCAQQDAKCASKCEAPPPTDSELAACDTCLAGQNNAQVNAIEKCYADASKIEDETKADAAFTKCDDLDQNKCDSKCDAAYKACSSKCGG